MIKYQKFTLVAYIALLNTVFTADNIEMEPEPAVAKSAVKPTDAEISPDLGDNILPTVDISPDFGDSILPTVDISPAVSSNASAAASVAAELLGDLLPAAAPSAPSFDVDLSATNPRKTMRLSVEIEVADLRPYAPGSIRFFFPDAPDVEIGTLPFASLIKSSRIGISDVVVIPDNPFKIAYDFRDKGGKKIGPFHWICNSIKYKDGVINPLGIFAEKAEESKEETRIQNKISAVRLKAFKGGQSMKDPPIRVGFVAPKYSEGAPLLKAVEEPILAPIGTMFNDSTLIAQAMKTYPGSAKATNAGAGDIEGNNCYCSVEFSDNSVVVAGEYIRLAQKKYNKTVARAEASQLIALLRNYGIVTRATSEELADYLGLT